jgi:uncharacterized cupin superfamily protein
MLLAQIPKSPTSVVAAEAPPRTKPSNYPEPFASMMNGRIKRPLGDLFGLQSFGVNHVTLPAGTMSALFHRHSVQDECILVLSGELTLVHDDGETLLAPGMFVGFPRNGSAHQLINRSTTEATYIEIGDRQSGDWVSYPRDDLVAVRAENGWTFTHKDGAPY